MAKEINTSPEVRAQTQNGNVKILFETFDHKLQLKYTTANQKAYRKTIFSNGSPHSVSDFYAKRRSPRGKMHNGDLKHTIRFRMSLIETRRIFPDTMQCIGIFNKSLLRGKPSQNGNLWELLIQVISPESHAHQ